ncbi:MAG: phosphorylase [Alicyclobacillaceae bacterium]|nr:phosphorylase [Alicyclobacillaceae bacterium]
MVLVLTALSFEAAAWRRVPGRGRSWLLAVTGVGPDRARRVAQVRMRETKPDLVIGAGVCGGLAPEDPAGQVVMPDEFVADDPDKPLLRRTWQPAELTASALVPGSIQTTGRMVSVRNPALTPEAKAVLASRHQARWVDQETYAWCEAALEAGVPFVCLRVVLDTAHESLPHWGNWRSLAGAWRLPRQALAARRVLSEAGGRFLCAHL